MEPDKSTGKDNSKPRDCLRVVPCSSDCAAALQNSLLLRAGARGAIDALNGCKARPCTLESAMDIVKASSSNNLHSQKTAESR